MSNMIVNVEFLAGTTIEQAITEAKSKAQKWGVAYVSFKLNGVYFRIGSSADVYEAVEEFKSIVGTDYYVIA